MSDNEEKALINLCGNDNAPVSIECLTYITPEVLGYLFSNHLAAYVYWKLKQQRLLQYLPPSVKNLLHEAFLCQAEKYKSYQMAIKLLSNALSRSGCPYAIINDAVACTFFPEGTRAGDEIDVLIECESLSAIESMLCEYGFRQGIVFNDVFVPLSCNNEVPIKDNEFFTFSYIKEVDLPWLPFLKVNIMFPAVDNGVFSAMLSKQINRIVRRQADDLIVSTFDTLDYIIFQCMLLVTKVFNVDTIDRDQKMMLHIYKNISMMLSHISTSEAEQLLCRMIDFSVLKECMKAISIVTTFIPIENTTVLQYFVIE